MKSKIFKNIFLMVVVFICISAKVVHAETYRSDFIDGGYIESKVYINKKQPNGNIKWKRVSIIIQESTGQVVYCMQPTLDIIDGAIYNVTTEDYAGAQNLSPEQYDRIRLLAYYGYGYADHTSTDWISVTQTLIWRTVRPDMDIYYSRSGEAKNRDDSIFADKIAELNNLVDNHYSRPSFNMNNIETVIGKTESVTDVNGVLNQYKIRSQSNVSATLEGNTLKITSTGVGNGEVILEKAEKRFGQAPIIFYATDSQNVLKPGDPNPVLAKLNLTISGGKVEISKVDAETGENSPQGIESTFKGATFGIYKEDGTRIQTVITGESGIGLSDYLPSLGRYYLQEEIPPIGYELNSTKYYFDITTNNLQPTITVREQVIKVKYNLTKVIAQDKTGDMIVEPDVKFAFYDKNGNLVQEVTTNKDGKLSVELPYGTYKVVQLTTSMGHQKLEDFTIEVRKTETINKVFANSELRAKLKVVKIDDETKNVIKRNHIKFKIFSVDKGDYVCQTVSYPDKKTYCEFETDENGEFITPYELTAGTYRLEELDQKIDGYLWNKVSQEFTIDDNANFVTDSKHGIIFTTQFANKPVKGTIKINKLGESFTVENGIYRYDSIVLDGVEFEIRAMEDIFSGGKRYYTKGELVGVIKTDENGVGTFDKLVPLGKYTLSEKNTNVNHTLLEEPIEFELEYQDQYTEKVVKTFDINNYYKKGTLEFTKTDLVDSKPIPGVEIKIFTEEDEEIFTGITDENGKVVIKDLPVGKRMYIIETKPAENYQITEEKVYFQILENGEVVKATMTNEKVIFDVPDTDVTDNHIIEIFALALIILGLGAMFYGKKK